MADVASDIVLAHLDRKLADRHRAVKARRESSELGELDLACCAVDGPRRKRNRRSGVLMLRIPGAARQLARDERTARRRRIRGVQGSAIPSCVIRKE